MLKLTAGEPPYFRKISYLRYKLSNIKMAKQNKDKPKEVE